MIRALFAALQLIVGGFTHLLIDWKAVGGKNVPRSGPVIVVANHLSMLDPLMLSLSIPGRSIRYLAKEELFEVPSLVIVLRLSRSMSIKRGTPDRRALGKALEVLGQGRVVGVFPEGTRSKTGALQAGHPGAALLALHSGAPVVPVGVTGTQAVFAGNRKWPRRNAPVRLRVGPPICLSRSEGPIRREQLDAATETIMRGLAALLPEEQRGEYRSTFAAAAESSKQL